MHISTLLLADVVRIREGLMSVISGGVTGLGADSYPMNAQLDIGLIVEVEANEWNGQLPINVKLERALEDGSSAAVSGYEGTYVGDLRKPGKPSAIPVALPLQPLEFPSPGSYFVVVEVGDLPPARLRVTARAPGESAASQ